MARPQVTPRAIAVARGDEPADLLITGGRVFSPATREWVDTELAIAEIDDRVTRHRQIPQRFLEGNARSIVQRTVDGQKSCAGATPKNSM